MSDRLHRAADNLCAVFENFDVRADLTASMNLGDAEAIALVALATDRIDLAQQIILDWTDGDPEAEEHEDRLREWGITRTADDTDDWRITDQPNAKELQP